MIRRVVACFILGLCTTLAISLGCWVWIDPTTGNIAGSARLKQGDSWCYWVIEQPGVVMVQRTHSHVAVDPNLLQLSGEAIIQKQPKPPAWSQLNQPRAADEPEAPRTICEVASGWPLVCLKTADLRIENATARLARPDRSIANIPFIPIPSGLSIDMGLFSCVWTAVLVWPRWMKRRIRLRRGCCPDCGYDLRGLPEEAECCSECGAPTGVSHTAQQHRG
jgi:hypothetical protein